MYRFYRHISFHGSVGNFLRCWPKLQQSISQCCWGGGFVLLSQANQPASQPACLDRRLAFACVGGSLKHLPAGVLNVCRERTLRNRATGRSVAETYRISIFQIQDGHASERDEHREICKHRDRLWAVPLVAVGSCTFHSRRLGDDAPPEYMTRYICVQESNHHSGSMAVRPTNRSIEESLSFPRPSPNGNVLHMLGGSYPCPSVALCTAHTA